MKKIYLLAALVTALTGAFSCAALTSRTNSHDPVSYREYVRSQGLDDISIRKPSVPEGKINFDDKNISIPVPSQPKVITPPSAQGNPPVQPPTVSGGQLGIDSGGHASVLTPNNSGGYLGFDRQGNGTMITPLAPGSRFGIDNFGNTWTIVPTRP